MIKDTEFTVELHTVKDAKSKLVMHDTRYQVYNGVILVHRTKYMVYDGVIH